MSVTPAAHVGSDRFLIVYGLRGRVLERCWPMSEPVRRGSRSQEMAHEGEILPEIGQEMCIVNG